MLGPEMATLHIHVAHVWGSSVSSYPFQVCTCTCLLRALGVYTRGIYTLGVYSLGIYSLQPAILDLGEHSRMVHTLGVY